MICRWMYYAISPFLLVLAAILISEAWWKGANDRNQVACLETRPAAVVFYAGNAAEDHRRLKSAFDLVREECVAVIALVGGARPEREFNGSRENMSILLSMGVERERIVLGSGSFDSYTNLDEMAGIFDARSWRSGILVSDCLHLDRLSRLSAPLTRFELERSCSQSPPFGIRLWRSANELVVYASAALPPDWRSWIVRRLRAQSSISDESPSNE
jgi:vancomycin permeability regulator SanA